jgi:hypothetical protein
VFRAKKKLGQKHASRLMAKTNEGAVRETIADARRSLYALGGPGFFIPSAGAAESAQYADPNARAHKATLNDRTIRECASEI